MSNPTETSEAPSKAVLIAAARMLIDEKDKPDFPIAEAMLRSLLNARATAEGDKILQRPARLPRRCMV